MTQRFGIFSPAMGVREDIPSILLPKVWHVDNSNIEIRHGEVRYARLRSAELMEEVCSTGKMIAINSSKVVIFIDIGTENNHPDWGSRAMTIDSVACTLDTKDTWIEGTLLADFTGASKGLTYAITALDTATKKVTISGNHASDYSADDKVVIYGSTDNDGIYTIVSATWNDPNTDIVVSEAIIDTNVDGNITDKGVAYTVGTAFTKVAVPDGNPILRYHLQPIGSPAVEYLFAFTKAHVYLWSNIWSAWILKHTCASDCTQWDTCNYEAQNVMIATNNIDKVLDWGGTVTAALSVLDQAGGIDYDGSHFLTKAKFVTSYENYLILGYTTEDGTTYPHRIRWSDLSLYETWESGDAGSTAVQGKGDINGFGHHRGLLWIFKKDLQGGSIQKYWLVAGDDVFNMDQYSPNIGCLAAESIINDKYGMLYFLATDYTIKNIEMEDISEGIPKTMKMIEPELAPYVKGRYMPEMDKLNWSIPYGAGATANNKVLAYYPEHKIWCFIDIPVTAFGCRTRSSDMTINSMPWPTLKAWPWEIINTVESKSGFVQEICGDASGYTYEIHGAYTDDGDSYTAYFVLSLDFAEKQGLHFFKRWLWNHVYVRNEHGGTMDFEVKRDTETTWQSSGSISLDGDEEILVDNYACDHRGKQYFLKCIASNKFAFLAMISEFEIDGMY